ncbi:hypothetical protein JKP88DRAFT_265067 [Tribonema minus]|uniref:Uncharacterized protein n=1 Tax=Tribonema minus TaxID=303371 RepID=A0A835YMQ2_9STRA|nr:hypothetical protein JKP88DRAFT_265067 [Tribonema minus]
MRLWWVLLVVVAAVTARTPDVHRLLSASSCASYDVLRTLCKCEVRRISFALIALSNSEQRDIVVCAAAFTVAHSLYFFLKPTRRRTRKPTPRATNPAPDPTKFNISLKFAADTPNDIKALFKKAAKKWESVITADVSDFPAWTKDWFGGFVPGVKYFGRVDDIVIAAQVTFLDGVGGTLAYSGPYYMRGDTKLPISGVLFFDVEDVQPLLDNGSFGDVVLHEMGHVLGIGIEDLWPTLASKCGGACKPKSDASYYTKGSTGTCYAQKAAAELGLKGRLQLGPPILLRERLPRANYFNYHFNYYFNYGIHGSLATSAATLLRDQVPLTDILRLRNATVTDNPPPDCPPLACHSGALQDLGYTVDYTKADAFDPAGCKRAPALGAAGDSDGSVVVWGNGNVVSPPVTFV